MTPASLVADIEQRFGTAPYATVVVATFNRPELLVKLLQSFEAQTMPEGSFEVVVVDDGSKEEVAPHTKGLGKRFRLRVERQPNGGAAVARQKGAELAKGHVLIFLDDDMLVAPDFIEAHLAMHADDHTVCIGKLEPDAKLSEMPLFERFYARMLARFAEAAASGEEVRGHNVYTGNLSVARDLFLRAGGFDASFKAIEDEELGIRFEKAGARFTFTARGKSVHGSDKTSMQKWLERSFRDGIYSTRVGRKHRGHDDASPFRHLTRINPLSKPLLAFSLAAPKAAAPIASAALRMAQGADRIGLEPLAIAGATLVYGMQFYRGVSEEVGGAGPAFREYREFTKGSALLAKDSAPRRALVEGIREDHRMLVHYATKYDGREGGRADGSEVDSGGAEGAGGLASSLVKKIGFQLMVSYRLMRFFRQSRLTLAAQATSRLIRHAYSSDVHWDCEIEPGVVVVHGFGMALSYAAYVSSGSILFQHVTLGYGSDPETKRAGGPRLERNVHVGIGATLFGPIVVGESSKIMAGCVLNRSVPARSVVEAPIPRVVPRKSGI